MDVHIKGSKNPTKWFYNSGMSTFFVDGLGYHHLVFPSPPICALCPPILWPLSRWAMANTWNSHQLPSKWKKIKRQKEHTNTKIEHLEPSPNCTILVFRIFPWCSQVILRMCGESCGPGGPVWSLGVCESSWLRGRGLEGLVGMVGLMGPVG